MTGTNHAVTGGVIGLAIGGPLAIPVAFASHFLLDWLPHLGFEKAEDRIASRNRLLIVIVIDGVLLAIVFGLAFAYGLPWYIFASMLVATTPDFAWIFRFIFEEKLGKIEPGPLTGLNKFHSDIQKRESPSGIWVEVFWLVLMSLIAFNLV